MIKGEVFGHLPCEHIERLALERTASLQAGWKRKRKMPESWGLANVGEMDYLQAPDCKRYHCWKWGPVACCSKASKEAGMVEKKICFILDAYNPGGRGEQTSVQRLTTPLPHRWGAIAFIDGVRGLHAVQHSQIWQSSWNQSSLVWPASSWLF